MLTDITLNMKCALCGQSSTIRTALDLPKLYITAERSEENDRKMIRYIARNFDMPRCQNRRCYGEEMDIVEID